MRELIPYRQESVARSPTERSAPAGWFVDRQYAVLQFSLAALSFVLCAVPAGFDYSYVLIANTLESPGHPWFRIQWTTLFGIALFIIFRRRAVALSMWRDINPFLVLFYGWCLLSAVWAPESGKALTQAASIAGIALMAWAQTLSAWQPPTLFSAMRFGLTAVLVASIGVATLNPELGIHGSDQFELLGSWRGATLTKNVLGQIGAIAIIVWTYTLLQGESRRSVAILGLCIAVFVTLKSRSSTSLILSMLSSLVLVALYKSPLDLRGSRARLLTMLALLFVVPLVIYSIFIGSFQYADLATPIAESVGKDASFSGRTDIWAEVWHSIWQRPILGTGFMGFWNGPDSLAGEALVRLGWDCPNGHNGYLDVWNELGTVGMLLFVGFLVLHTWQLMQLARKDRRQFAAHYVLFQYLLLANLTESGWFRPISVTQVVSMYSSLTVARLLFEHRLRSFRQSELTVRPSAPVPGQVS